MLLVVPRFKFTPAYNFPALRHGSHAVPAERVRPVETRP
jgi:hypothetical protein